MLGSSPGFTTISREKLFLISCPHEQQTLDSFSVCIDNINWPRTYTTRSRPILLLDKWSEQEVRCTLIHVTSYYFLFAQLENKKSSQKRSSPKWTDKYIQGKLPKKNKDFVFTLGNYPKPTRNSLVSPFGYSVCGMGLQPKLFRITTKFFLFFQGSTKNNQGT